MEGARPLPFGHANQRTKLDKIESQIIDQRSLAFLLSPLPILFRPQAVPRRLEKVEQQHGDDNHDDDRERHDADGYGQADDEGDEDGRGDEAADQIIHGLSINLIPRETPATSARF